MTGITRAIEVSENMSVTLDVFSVFYFDRVWSLWFLSSRYFRNQSPLFNNPRTLAQWPGRSHMFCCDGSSLRIRPSIKKWIRETSTLHARRLLRGGGISFITVALWMEMLDLMSQVVPRVPIVVEI